MRLCLLSSILTCIYMLLSCSSLPSVTCYRQKVIDSEYMPPASGFRVWENRYAVEPSCEELRAMWHFSKRQSRASEITNEVPTYRDPLAYNVWEPYARSRSIGGGVLTRPGRGHIYGKVVYAMPGSVTYQSRPERFRAFEEVAKMLVSSRRGVPQRKVTAFRYSRGRVPYQDIPAQ
ncbi:uncharacterized protein LOC124625811 [Schistocerca americana]|uniref:uncharacterized protein LOC124625811 n=1 Tax=Schistocerca americana TaxID=7009 RepID=UPI001F4FC6E4|nr:uncharacterized protein LOC124625811 [Schistocerca americana]XP_047097061.1 uncharacterized protein LOC124711178 [Schistocerca piceifrons]XP_049766648.1 uncharacterized protein LOC126100149 [Schistocerca cancellata]